MFVLDAGAFVAVEHGSRDVAALVKRERLAGRPPVTSGGVITQVWRGGSAALLASAHHPRQICAGRYRIDSWILRSACGTS